MLTAHMLKSTDPPPGRRVASQWPPPTDIRSWREESGASPSIGPRTRPGTDQRNEVGCRGARIAVLFYEFEFLRVTVTVRVASCLNSMTREKTCTGSDR
jgi:hypothetical protein